ncbi:hypothetical protein F5B22DRAFT_615536 [Xylaria bambusicola]|uniref:uncharacterized protein n=1 Tax=Xylaria bambusicola TaxID=326684 RepID=UPI0020082705|nr:uncharacterized protein F5B22DRAFT_615536 [Xylaria bambusicola]KAI0509677.1 hypothetical protein F5B22DRAFT_615536 [Xylaria bambusicola]
MIPAKTLLDPLRSSLFLFLSLLLPTSCLPLPADLFFSARSRQAKVALALFGWLLVRATSKQPTCTTTLLALQIITRQGLSPSPGGQILQQRRGTSADLQLAHFHYCTYTTWFVLPCLVTRSINKYRLSQDFICVYCYLL